MRGAPLITLRPRAAVLAKSNQCSHLPPSTSNFEVRPFTAQTTAEIRPMTVQQMLAVETSVPVQYHEILSCLGGSKISRQGGRRPINKPRPEKDQSLSQSKRYRGSSTRRVVNLPRRMAIVEKIDPSHRRKSPG